MMTTAINQPMTSTRNTAERFGENTIKLIGPEKILDHTLGVQRFEISLYLDLSAPVPLYLMRTWKGMRAYNRKMQDKGYPLVSCIFRRTKRDQNTWSLSEIELPEVIATGRYTGSTLAHSGWKHISSSIDLLGFNIMDELKDVRFGEGITEIVEGEFENLKNLQSVIVPEGVEVIGRRAFSHSSARYISLPSTLKEVQPHAFRKCENLEHVDVLSTAPKFNNIRK